MPTGSTKTGDSTDFVYFEDKGSVYDAPIDVVWDFIMNDNEFHPQAHHGSLRNMKWKEMNEITAEATCEVVRGGRWMKMKARITTIPPLARINEEFEGAYAGLKMVFLYTSKGNKTGIDVYVRAPKAVANELRETLAKAFQEDVPMLRAFARKRRQE
jgi:hypothetical protein